MKAKLLLQISFQYPDFPEAFDLAYVVVAIHLPPPLQTKLMTLV